MATLFLMLIYLAFISLGLPDSLLGAAWPAMRLDLGAGLDAAGLVTMTVSSGTIISSLLSDKLTRRFGAGKVCAVSVLATAAALMGFSASPAYGWLILFAIPLGLGAGAVDAALNNYVALHYEARHMSWLHSFWGVGASLGPVIMASFMARAGNWRGGYRTIGIIQLGVAALLLLSLPMWARRAAQPAKPQAGAEDAGAPPAKNVLRIPGVPAALMTFFCYCAIEMGTGLWASSFLVEAHGYSPDMAARGGALYYGGITVGRFLSGFVASRFSGAQLIRMGGIGVLMGVVLFLLPLPGPVSFVALLLIGLGGAPVYPCMIHETPRRFGPQNSQRVIGMQMAVAYMGSTFVPPLIGLAADKAGVRSMPVILLALTLGQLFFSERTDRVTLRSQTPH